MIFMKNIKIYDVLFNLCNGYGVLLLNKCNLVIYVWGLYLYKNIVYV